MFVLPDETSGIRSEAVFDLERWIDYSEQKLNGFLASAVVGPLQLPQSFSFLHFYARDMAAAQTPETPLRVLDLGGGVGQMFPILRTVLNNARQGIPLDYTVVDGAGACQRGKEVFSGSRPINLNESGRKVSVRDICLPADRINFLNNIENREEGIDILVSTVTLMYIDDLTRILTTIRDKMPKLVFFSYFLANTEGGSVPLSQTFEEGGDQTCLDVTAHDTSDLIKTFENMGYREIPATGNYEIEGAEELSVSLSRSYPGVRMVDLFFRYIGD